MIEVIPAVLEKSGDKLQSKVQGLPAEVSLVHIDVLEEDVWAPIERDFEAHLMVERPTDIVERWVERGAKRLVVHKLEGTSKGEYELGLGVELHVSLEDVLPLLAQVDFVQLMSIAEIGAQGQPFDTQIFDRIKEVKRNSPNTLVSVDGGIDATNCRELIEAGADRLCVGSKFEEVWNLLMKE